MKQIFFLLMMLAIVSSTSVIEFGYLNYCSCSQLNYDTDCISSPFHCTWNQNACMDTPCSNLDIKSCPSDYRCMIVENTCTTFSQCSSLVGTTIQQCFDQANRCTYISGQNCAEDVLQKCSSLSEEDCLTVQASNGVCYINEINTCAQLQNCGTLSNQNDCTKTRNTCTWNGTKCIENSCGSMLTEQDCKSYPISTTNLYNIQLCHWIIDTSGQGICEEENTDSFNQATCQTLSYYTYHWNGSACTSCHNSYANVVNVIIIFALIYL